VIRTGVASLIALLALTSPANEYRGLNAQARGVRDLVADLAAADPAARVRAACEIRELGDTAADAIQRMPASSTNRRC